MKNELNKFIDHTLLSPDMTKESLDQLVREANEYEFCAICIPPAYIKEVKNTNNKFKICTVIGFPFGYQSTETKVQEAVNAIKDGAEEIDMVINISAFKMGREDEIKKEISLIKKSIKDKILKVIIETSYWDKNQIKRLTEIIIESGADYIKTSTGFSSSGAQLEDLRIMKQTIDHNKSNLKIKASGGIQSTKEALAILSIGVERLGTSKGVFLVENKEITDKNSY